MALVVWECNSIIESLPTSNSTDNDSDGCEPPISSSAMPRSHTVVFKCLSAIRDTQSQQVLYQAIDNEWSVPV